MRASAIKRLHQLQAAVKRRCLRGLLMCGLALISSPLPLAAATQESGAFYQQIQFDIPPQPLALALKVFADQAGVQIFYRSNIVPAINTQAIRESLTPERALDQLLSGTDLRYTWGGRNALVIHRPEVEPYDSVSPVAPQPPLKQRAIEETYVTGVRNSLRVNLAAKRQAANIIDVITSSDIGKFPDRNVADALQRVAGVSVDRLWGEGRDVNIRGTDKDINRTLLNGQHVASAYWWANDNLSRGFNYSTLASQLVQSIEVHKTPRADIDEGSIGGTVLVRTRRPLSMAGPMFSISVEEQYSDLAQSWDPQTSLLGSWNNPDRTWGMLTSLHWQERQSRRDGQETFADNTLYTITEPDGTVTENVYAIWGGGTALLEQDREHFTGNVTLQWSPDERWDSALNVLRSQMDIDSVNHNYLFAPGGFKLRQESPAAVANPEYRPSDDGYLNLAAGTLTGADTTGALLDAIYRQGYIDTDVIDWDTRFSHGPWQLHWQLGQTQSSGGTDHDYLYRFLGDTRTRFALTHDSVQVEYLDLDPTDARALTQYSPDSRDLIRDMSNRENYAQLDFAYHPQVSWLNTLKAGIKVRDHRVVNRQMIGEIDPTYAGWDNLQHTSLADVSNGLTPALLPHVDGASSVTRYARTRNALLQNILLTHYGAGLLRYREDTDAYYQIDEESIAYYLSAEFTGQRWQANFGLRAVATRQDASGYLSDHLVTVKHRYHNLLPNLNVRYQLQDNLVLRGSLARVMARPNYEDVSPGFILDPTSGSGLAGNPMLDPYGADQLDVSAEWYRSDTSLLSIAGFYKDFSSFVYPSTEFREIDGRVLNITHPTNIRGVSIHGLELRWQQDIAWGFGVQSNYTYTDAQVPAPAEGPAIQLPGNSRDQFNASVYFEGERLDARLSYNYRSSSYGEVRAGSQSQAASYTQVDGSVHWHLNEQASFSIEGINLTNEIIYIRSASGIPQGFYENGRRILVGLRYHWE
ncbi:TonB-dependent receptor [uncultured Gilvimarinus sp.]|uniref:TonB-dependent receptor n=1 Tax=uncultured Gilvimarinus sp. TaxID=1689143 RepID=UPI0030D7DA1E